MSQFKQSRLIPPRQFPKRQYRRLSYQLWAITIGIIIIIVILISVAFMIGYKSTNYCTNHNYVKSFQTTQSSKIIHHNSRTSSITPKQGEKLLGHWLLRLDYSQNESQRILINYQNSDIIQEKAIARQLANDTRPNQIRKLIHRNDKFSQKNLVK